MASLMGMGLVGQALGQGDGGVPLGLASGLLGRKKSKGAPAAPGATILTDAVQKRRERV